MTIQTQAVNAAASATKRLPTTCHQQATGFSAGITAAGGNVAAGGVATLAPLHPLPSLPQALGDVSNDANVEEDDYDELEIVPQEYEEEAEAAKGQEELVVKEETEPVEEPAMVEASEMPPDVRTLTHNKTKCFAMPFGNRETFCFSTN